MSPERGKNQPSSESHHKRLRENEYETKLDLTSSDDLKNTRLERNEAKRLAAQILKFGDVVPTGHCIKRLTERSMNLQDVSNVLRAGAITKEPEPDAPFGVCRYTIETAKMAIVFEFITMSSLRVITAWRKT